jgi:hypothetical protein
MPIQMGPSADFDMPDNDAFLEALQAKIDRSNKTARRRRLHKLEGLRRYRMIEIIEWIALKEKVSVPRALELMVERLADGSLKARGHAGSPDGPLQEVPAQVFRGPPV